MVRLVRLTSTVLLAALSVPVTSFSPPHSSTIKPNPCIKDQSEKNHPSTFFSLRGGSQLRNSVTDQAESVLKVADDVVVDRAVRIVNHVPALASLAYFGLISSASMMMSSMTDVDKMPATLASVLTRGVGATSNNEFARLFPTLITPPAPVFLVWPLIAVVQLVLVTLSALRPGDSPVFSQDDLSALSTANLASSAWLIVSSFATEGNLPIGSFLVLPFVPVLSGFPLRAFGSSGGDATSITLRNLPFQIFSSFTTVASFLALTVELLHGGRIPFFGGRQEICALVFLGLYAINADRAANGPVKRFVNAGAITGILIKRLLEGASNSVGGFFRLFLSPSFLATAAVTWISVAKLFPQD